MAIDNAEKRRSVSGVWMLIPGVTPDSGKSIEWRYQCGWNYSGITTVIVLYVADKLGAGMLSGGRL